MKGKRKPNGHQEEKTQGENNSISAQSMIDLIIILISILSLVTLKVDTIVGIHHKSAVITLVERLSKVIITIKPNGRKALDIETAP